MQHKVYRCDLVQTVVDEIGLTKQDGEAIYDRMMELMKDSILRGESVVIRGLGVFEVRVYLSAKGVGATNKRTRRVVRFVPSQTMMKRLASGKRFIRGELSGVIKRARRIAEGRPPKPGYILHRAKNAAKLVHGGGEVGDVGVEKGDLGRKE